MHMSRRVTTTVQAGGRIEVSAADLPTGQSVEVTIRPTNGHPPRRSVLDILAEASGGRVFKSAADVDRYIRAERDAWDR